MRDLSPGLRHSNPRSLALPTGSVLRQNVMAGRARGRSYSCPVLQKPESNQGSRGRPSGTNQVQQRQASKDLQLEARPCLLKLQHLPKQFHHLETTCGPEGDISYSNLKVLLFLKLCQEGFSRFSTFKCYTVAGKMTHQASALAAKPADLSLMPRTHMVREDHGRSVETLPPLLSSQPGLQCCKYHNESQFGEERIISLYRLG